MSTTVYLKTQKIHEVFDFSSSQFLEKLQKRIRKLPDEAMVVLQENSNSSNSCEILHLTHILGIHYGTR